ncbi:MAG: hypothetical protein WC124_06575 [Desulfoplanes sp.]
MPQRIEALWTLEHQVAKMRIGKIPDWNPSIANISPNIWEDFNENPAGLDTMFQACPDSRIFVSTLLCAYLLEPEKAPIFLRSWFEQNRVCSLLRCDTPLDILVHARWRKVAIPVAVTGHGTLQWAMVGAGPHLPLFPGGSALFDQQACAAVDIVRDIFVGTGNDMLGVWPIHAADHKKTVDGPSLGLPILLGAIAARDNLDCSDILATGTLTPDGRIEQVGLIREKMRCACKGVRVFLHPRRLHPDECLDEETTLECIPVDTIRQAQAVLRCHDPGLGHKVVTAQDVLDSGTGMARELCGLQSGMEKWVWQNQKNIGERLKHDDNLKALVAQLKQWCHSTTGKDYSLGYAVLDCLDMGTVRFLAEQGTTPAWDITLLHMDKANHGGRIDVFPGWQHIAEGLRVEVLRQNDGEQENLLFYIRTAINNSHNCFNFSPELPERIQATMSLDTEIHEMEKRFERRCTRSGPCEDSVLGRYYGTLGQHFLFCGPKYHKKGLGFLDKAMHAFGDGLVDGDCNKEWKRDLFYKAFGLIETREFSAATGELGRVCGRDKDGSWPVKDMSPFELHCLVRLHVDSGQVIAPALWSEIQNMIQEITGHPGQLLALNLALLAEKKTIRQKWYEISLERCRHSGPTIKAMALLPLAHMHHEDMDLPDAEKHCAEVLEVIKTTELHNEHFRPVLESGSWQEMLTRVLEMKRMLYPYMYR